MLMGAGAGAVGLAAVEIGLPAATASASEDKSSPSLTGGWLIIHRDTSPDQGSDVQAVVTFAAGGALVSRDINPPGDPQLGAWRATDDHGFVGTFYDSFSDNPSGPVSILKVTVKGTEDADNDKISGTFSATITPPPPGAPPITGTFEGTRIVPGS
jgi:hypothetical protein